MGGTVRALEVFTQSAHASFLRAGSTPKCAALQCGKLLRSPSLTGLPTAITLSAAELTDAEGDCFAALQAKVNTPGKQGKRQKKRACPHCNLDSHFLEQPHTSVVADGAAPTLLVLDLPIKPPYPAAALPYDLRPSAEPRPLDIGGTVQGSYRLVGVLMYATRYHFFADVIDPRERRWLRYDGRVAPARGSSRRRRSRSPCPARRCGWRRGPRTRAGWAGDPPRSCRCRRRAARCRKGTASTAAARRRRWCRQQAPLPCSSPARRRRWRRDPRRLRSARR